MSNSGNTKQKHISNEMLVVWYEALLNRFNTVKESTNAIDNKTSIILAAAVAVLIFGVTGTLSDMQTLKIVGLSGVTLSILLCLVNINLKETPAEVNSSDDRPDYYSKSDEQFMWHLIADLENAIQILGVMNIKKARLYRWLSSIFAISSVLLLAASYVQIKIMFSIN